MKAQHSYISIIRKILVSLERKIKLYKYHVISEVFSRLRTATSL